MSAVPDIDSRRSKGRPYVELATTVDDIRASQALRHPVSGEEGGATLLTADDRLDTDHFDRYCQHLLVRDSHSGQVIGSTRLLLDSQARKAGGFYSQGGFDLAPLLALPGRRLEVGRTCIDPNYRRGAAIAVLWSGLAEFVRGNRIDMLFGYASVEMDDGGIQAQAIMNRVWQHAMIDADCRITPFRPLPALPDDTQHTVSAPFPLLLKAYLRLGAKACGEPCYDPDFNCADFLVLVKVREIGASYSRHFLDRVMHN